MPFPFPIALRGPIWFAPLQTKVTSRFRNLLPAHAVAMSTAQVAKPLGVPAWTPPPRPWLQLYNVHVKPPPAYVLEVRGRARRRGAWAKDPDTMHSAQFRSAAASQHAWRGLWI